MKWPDRSGLRSDQGAKPASPRSPLKSILELVLTVAVAVGVALLVQALLIKPYMIPSGSMEPTLAVGQRILVNRLDTQPALGDVVVFHPPSGAPSFCENHEQGPGQRSGQACDDATPAESTQTFVKRVVGLPGDRIRIVDGYVYRNGHRETGSYVNTSNCSGPTQECDLPTTITVPRGDYYMMGDNRGDSADSRYWGPVPQRYIIGVVFFTYWPLNRIGFM